MPTPAPQAPAGRADPRQLRPPAEELVHALFGQAPSDQFFEIRAIAQGRKASQHFFDLTDLQKQSWRQIVPNHLQRGFNVYFGVCPRVRRRGRKDDVAAAYCLWADLDHGWPDPWPESVPEPAAVVESSPGKWQVYWLLDEPAADLDLVERIENGLAAILGADPAATDRARVLRLPGFPNLKYDSRPVSRLLELHLERRYPLERFTALVPAEQTRHRGQAHHHGEHRSHGSRRESRPIRREFKRLMAKRCITPGVNPTWCFAHDDKREGGTPSLSVDWEECLFKCHSPRCGVHGGIGALRKLAGETTPPSVHSDSPWAQRGVSEKQRLIAALREVGDEEPAAAVQSCHEDYRAYKCKGCGKTPAFPISCGLPLCPECLASRFYGFWQKHRGQLSGALALVRLTPPGSFPLAKASMKTVRNRFTQWRKRNDVECGLYALIPTVNEGQCRIDILLVMPQSELSKVASGRAFEVDVFSPRCSERDACSWLIGSLMQGVTSWQTAEDMVALRSMLKGTSVVFGFGEWHRVRGGRSKGPSDEKPTCPFCGDELTPLGAVPRDSVVNEEGHFVWRPPPWEIAA